MAEIMTDTVPKSSAALPQPDYAALHTWDNYSAQLLVEYEQCVDEGREMSGLKDVFEVVSHLPESHEKAQLADILHRMAMAAPVRAGYAYDEPTGYDAIQSRCAHWTPRKVPADQALREKVRGAWYGRISGCLLGKPIEGFWRSEMIPLLKGTGNWPLRSYIARKDISPQLREQFQFDVYHRCYADTLDGAPADDDTNYTVLAGELIERYGRNFTSQDVADLWLEAQPKSAYCTAERVAFRNLVNGYRPPAAAVYKNPYREWIGAQIRGDYFGYINPGDPQTAAQMAWRDAVVSHVKNGVYGEMFAAAMLAWAPVSGSAEEVIAAGLSQIPSTSRLYESIRQVLDWKAQGDPHDRVLEKLYERYDDQNIHHWDHTIPNAMIVAAALLYGQGDFGKSICLAVQSAFDTDCNGATVGSVVGMMQGFSAIGAQWLEPIHGVLDTDLFGVGKVSVENLVDRTMKHLQTDAEKSE